MENASKALYMAAGVLISLMILSILIYVFRMGGQVGEKYDQKQAQGQIELFNAKFENFQKENNTISDMISVTNLANDVNRESAYNSTMSVSINIEIGTNKYFCITPKQEVERNYIFVGKSTNTFNSNSEKIYVYDLMNTQGQIDTYRGNPPNKVGTTNISGIASGETLAKVNNEMVYKYYFECTSISYHQKGGRVSAMSFELKNNSKYVETP